VPRKEEVVDTVESVYSEILVEGGSMMSAQTLFTVVAYLCAIGLCLILVLGALTGWYPWPMLSATLFVVAGLKFLDAAYSWRKEYSDD